MPVTPDALFGLESLGRSVELFRDISFNTRLSQLFEEEECYADVYRYDREDYELSLAPITGQLPVTIPGVAPFGAGLRRDGPPLP